MWTLLRPIQNRPMTPRRARLLPPLTIIAVAVALVAAVAAVP
jgi:hypothetical protein